jgi:hypothetical protein
MRVLPLAIYIYASLTFVLLIFVVACVWKRRSTAKAKHRELLDGLDKLAKADPTDMQELAAATFSKLTLPFDYYGESKSARTELEGKIDALGLELKKLVPETGTVGRGKAVAEPSTRTRVEEAVEAGRAAYENAVRRAETTKPRIGTEAVIAEDSPYPHVVRIVLERFPVLSETFTTLLLKLPVAEQTAFAGRLIRWRTDEDEAQLEYKVGELIREMAQILERGRTTRTEREFEGSGEK